ncbi:hypothetical protein T492DRAFT_967688 [Pavlovales sp. CCMP2436]|nr:hypothetical protein T492DRAFT_967688 [Pavlovales sp. CCMP2436]
MPLGPLHVSASPAVRHIGVQATAYAAAVARDPLAEQPLEALFAWLVGYRDLFARSCHACGQQLEWDPLFGAFVPPSSNPWERRLMTAAPAPLYHRLCCPADDADGTG